MIGKTSGGVDLISSGGQDIETKWSFLSTMILISLAKVENASIRNRSCRGPTGVLLHFISVVLLEVKHRDWPQFYSNNPLMFIEVIKPSTSSRGIDLHKVTCIF